MAKQFGITKHGPTHVQDNRVVADGYNIEEVEAALNLDALRAFVGVEHTDLGTLLTLAVAKIEHPEPSVLAEEEPIIPQEIVERVAKAKKAVTKIKKAYGKRKTGNKK